MREKGILNELHKDCIIEKGYIEENPRSNPTTFIHKFIFLLLQVMIDKNTDHCLPIVTIYRSETSVKTNLRSCLK